MRTLLRISNIIDAFVEWVGRSMTWIVIIMILAGFYNVVARYLGRFIGARLTSNALIETQWYLFSIMFFLGFSYILKHNLNVRVDFLYGKWSPKRKALIDLIGHVLFLIPFCILGIYVTLNPVMLSWGRLPDGSFGTWEISPDPDGLPRAPIKSMIIVAFFLLLIQAISQVIKYIAMLTEKTRPEAVSEVEEYHPTAIE